MSEPPDDTAPKPPLPIPETAAGMRALADSYAQQVRVLEGKLETLRQLQGLYERRAEAMEGNGPVRIMLRHDNTDDTLGNMNLDTRKSSDSVKRAVGRATRQHPAQVAFYKHNVTIGEVAARLGEGRPRVSSWMAKGDAFRPIPRRCQRLLEKWYGIPEGAWARVKD